MNGRNALWAIALFSGLLLIAGHLVGQPGDTCLKETEPVAGMARESVRFTDDAGAVRGGIEVRIADTASRRAAGMQHLCPESIKDNPILFVFPAAGSPAFHMNNVHAPLDMVFIDADLRVTEIRRMEPGPRLMRPQTDITHALELAAGQARAIGIEPGMLLVRGTRED